MRECSKEHISVALVGLGTIGTGVVKTFIKNGRIIDEKAGIPVRLKWICDIDLERDRGIDLSPFRTTRDFNDIIEDRDIDIVIELIGGVDAAHTLITGALSKGKHVVTANKALLAERGKEVFETAFSNKAEIGFEASVAGGIPIIKTVSESLAANRIEKIYGIINGTANYVLTKMEEENLDFEEALRLAQAKGYAEADPTLDIEGIDAAHKAAILASLAFGAIFELKDVYVEGISKVTHLDVIFSLDLGYRLKLLAIIKNHMPKVEIRVHPTLIPLASSLATVRGAYNALMVVGDIVGDTMYYGMGAGMMPTASAVVADVIDIARKIASGSAGKKPSFSFPHNGEIKVKPIEEIVTKYYLRFSALDRPGVLSKISGILGSHNISIESVIQKGRKVSGYVPIVMTTHEAPESQMRKAIEEIDQLDVIGSPTTLIRIENHL